MCTASQFDHFVIGRDEMTHKESGPLHSLVSVELRLQHGLMPSLSHLGTMLMSATCSYISLQLLESDSYIQGNKICALNSCTLTPVPRSVLQSLGRCPSQLNSACIHWSLMCPSLDAGYRSDQSGLKLML